MGLQVTEEEKSTQAIYDVGVELDRTRKWHTVRDELCKIYIYIIK